MSVYILYYICITFLFCCYEGEAYVCYSKVTCCSCLIHLIQNKWIISPLNVVKWWFKVAENGNTPVKITFFLFPFALRYLL